MSEIPITNFTAINTQLPLDVIRNDVIRNDVIDSDFDYYFLNVNNTDNFCQSNLSKYYFNITCQIPINYAVPMYGYVAPFLLVTTTIFNTLIVVVLSRRHMRTPTNTVLMGMALCDMFTLLFPAPWLFYMYSFGNHWRPLNPVAACYAWHLMNDVIPAMFHTASIWLTLALAIQRYIYVCHAPVARTWCTMQIVNRGMILICAAAFLHQLPKFFDQKFEPLHIYWNGRMEEVCTQRTADWVEAISENAFYMSYFVFRVTFVNVVPCVALVVLNILLFRALGKAQKNKKKLLKDNRKNESKKMRDSNCTTLMLIVVVTVFLMVEIPVAVVTILHIISSALVPILDYYIANVLVLVTNFFIIISYPINFAIYCGMSRQFRETFKELFIRGGANRKNGGSSRYSLVNGPRTCTNETVL